MRLHVATDDGYRAFEKEGDAWQPALRNLEGLRLSCVACRNDTVLAGSAEGLVRSADAGRDWQAAGEGLSVRHLRWLAFHPRRAGTALAGTEPAALFVSPDDGLTWRECIEVAELRERGGWYLPYSPEAGCVRGFALHGRRAYAAVEQGGVLRSEDAGESWALAPGSTGKTETPTPAGYIHPDVHSVKVHVSSPDLVLAPTGGGLYFSGDGGAQWRLLYECYCRAGWMNPRDPEHIVFGPAEGVSEGGRIEVSRDGGRSWQDASEGLETPWPEDMVDRLAAARQKLIGVLTDGRLIAADARELQWRWILPGIEDARAVAVAWS